MRIICARRHPSRINVKALCVWGAFFISTCQSAGGLGNSWIDVQRKNKNAVAQIFAYNIQKNIVEPHQSPRESAGCGSGFFLDKSFIGEEGYIITNFHVVAGVGSLGRVQIQIPSLGKERLSATIVGVCPDHDVALLRLKDNDLKRVRAANDTMPSLKLGSSDELEIGQEVAVLGYPLGFEQIKMTIGCFSGPHRSDKSYYQIDAAINPGNSGGPCFNKMGELVGINTAKYERADLMGLMMPIDDIKRIILELKNKKLLNAPTIGIEIGYTDPELLADLGNPTDGGVYFKKVVSGMPLAEAGTQEGDVLYMIDGHKLDCFGDLKSPWNDEERISLFDYASRLVVGDVCTFVLYRKGERLEFKLMLEDRKMPIRKVYPEFEELDYEVFMGCEFMEMTTNHIDLLAPYNLSLLRFYNSDNCLDSCVVITNILGGSAEAQARILRKGQLVEEVNGLPIKTLDDLRDAFAKSFETGKIRFKTEDKSVMVRPLIDVLSQEEGLIEAYGYKQTPFSKNMILTFVNKASGEIAVAG